MRRISWKYLAVPALLALPAVPVLGGNQASQQLTATANAAATNDPKYVIGPADVIDINVWKEPDVTRTIPVRPDGKISLPLLNDVQAAGLTPQQLGSKLTQDLRKYITNPQVTVIVTAINSQRIYVMGEVNHPGAYPLLPNTTVLAALSGAGGFTQFAKLKGIYVLRTVNGEQAKLPFNYKDVIKGEDTQENRALQTGDTIIVP